MGTITVWITEHDDPDVGYVVNDTDDMLQNFEDLVTEGHLHAGDFQRYLDSWTKLEMPEEIVNGPDPARIAWIDAHL